MNIAFLGHSMIDECYELRDSHYPVAGGKSHVHYKGACCGGMTANAAVVGASLGMKGTLVYDLSDTHNATQQILDDLTSHHISVDGVSFSKRSTPRCLLICNQQGERIIYVLDNHTMPLITLSPTQKHILFSSDYIYTNINDFQLYADKKELFTALQNKQMNIFIDCDSHIAKEEIEDLRYATIVSFNEFGYRVLNQLGYTASDIISQYDVSYVLVTEGAQGSTLYSAEELVYQTAFETKVVDTTWAGDGFNISFLFGLLSGFGIRKSLVFSSAVSAYIVAHEGTRVSINMDVIKTRVQEYFDHHIDTDMV